MKTMLIIAGGCAAALLLAIIVASGYSAGSVSEDFRPGYVAGTTTERLQPDAGGGDTAEGVLPATGSGSAGPAGLEPAFAAAFSASGVMFVGGIILLVVSSGPSRWERRTRVEA